MDIADLLELGRRVGDKLATRGETIALAESSAGGLISAALLARPGASAYYLGGAVLYTRRSGRLLTALASGDTAGLRSSTPDYARVLARHQRTRFRPDRRGIPMVIQPATHAWRSTDCWRATACCALVMTTEGET